MVKMVDISTQEWYNIIKKGGQNNKRERRWKGKKAKMRRKKKVHKKKPIDWQNLLIGAVIDLIIGIILLKLES